MSVSSDKSSTINGDRSASTDIEPDDKQKAMGVTGPELAAGGGDSEKKHRSDGKVELTEDDAEEKLGYAYPEWKKWLILVSSLSLIGEGHTDTTRLLFC